MWENGLHGVRENGLHEVRENGLHGVRENGLHGVWENGLHGVRENGLHGVRENGLHAIQDAVSHAIEDGGLNGLQSTTPISSPQDKTISTQQYNYTLPIPPLSDPPCNLMQYFLLVSYTHTRLIEVTNLPINYQLPSPLPSHHTIQSIDHNIPTFSSLRATYLQPSFAQLLNGEPN